MAHFTASELLLRQERKKAKVFRVLFILDYMHEQTRNICSKFYPVCNGKRLYGEAGVFVF